MITYDWLVTFNDRSSYKTEGFSAATCVPNAIIQHANARGHKADDAYMAVWNLHVVSIERLDHAAPGRL